MKRIFIILIMFVPMFVWGQNKLSPYTAQLLNAFERAQVTGDLTVLKPFRVKQLPESTVIVPGFIHLDNADHLYLLEKAGVHVGTVAGNIVTARIPLDKIQEIAGMEVVKYIEIGTPVYARMDEAKKSVGADLAHQGSDLPQAFRGKDVVVGIVDTGFEYGHAAFWNDDRTELRVKRVWNQNKEGGSPDGFDYGTEYTTQEDIMQALRDSTIDTHGTHVAGIAAGSAQTGEYDYSGIASESDIVLVSLDMEEMAVGNNATVIDGINYVYKYAESVGKPCVVNISIGTHTGPHDGTSTFDQMTDALQGPGKLLVGAVGNEGADKFHVSQTFRAERKDTLKTFIDFTFTYPLLSSIDIWGDEGMEYSFIPFIYNISENKVISVCEPTKVPNDNAGIKEYNITEGMKGTIFAATEINPNNRKPHIAVSADFFNSTTHRLGFYVVSEDNGTVHLWADNYYSGLSNFGLAGFTDGDNACSMGEVGGTGKRIISVGAYVTRDHYYRYGIYYPSGEKLGDICSYSSHGPTADGRIKPEIAAPGSFIISSLSAYYEGTKIKAVSESLNGRDYEFGYMEGSSMASPLVAGAIALWLQADPELTPESVRDILKQTAVRDEYTGILDGEEGNNVWGYGKLNVWNGLKECLRFTGMDEISGNVPGVIIANKDKRLDLLFVQADSNVAMQVCDANGRIVLNRLLKNVGQGDVYQVDLSGMAAGIYVVRITGNKNLISQKLIIK